MIKPTIGRVVWYWPRKNEGNQFDAKQPYSAEVVYVHNDRLVNLAVSDHAGVRKFAAKVQLVQEVEGVVDAVEPDTAYAEWMPYQKEQAAKPATLTLPKK